MDQVRSAAHALGGSFGVPEDGQLPARGPEHDVAEGRSVRGARSWLGVAVRIVRNAAIAVALMTMVPIALVSISGPRIFRSGVPSVNTRVRVGLAERTRPFALPKDPSITPMQAGLAFNALQPGRSAKEHTGFPLIEPATRAVLPWATEKITDDMFRTARPDMYAGPSSTSILEASVKGFSPAEAAYLRTLATAPLWRDFNVVATAPAVDIVGGQFKLPFAPTSAWEMMPITKFKYMKEMAYASVSRAAWYMSVGQKDSAETALRSVVSVGFALVDNGTNLLDELIGGVIVGIGRDALQRFYVITGDARAASPALAPLQKSDVRIPGPTISALPYDEVRAQLIAKVSDPSALRGERFETVRLLSLSSCTNVRELMFGPRSDVTDAIAAARRDLARYPSERAVVDLVSSLPKVTGRDAATYNPLVQLAVSTATVAGTVLQNPRMATCTLIASQYRMMP